MIPLPPFKKHVRDSQAEKATTDCGAALKVATTTAVATVVPFYCAMCVGGMASYDMCVLQLHFVSTTDGYRLAGDPLFTFLFSPLLTRLPASSSFPSLHYSYGGSGF